MPVRYLDYLFRTLHSMVPQHPRHMVEGDSTKVAFGNVDEALMEPDTQIRLFGKPEVCGHRRMAVVLARAESVEAARAKALRATNKLTITL